MMFVYNTSIYICTISQIIMMYLLVSVLRYDVSASVCLSVCLSLSLSHMTCRGSPEKKGPAFASRRTWSPAKRKWNCRGPLERSARTYGLRFGCVLGFIPLAGLESARTGGRFFHGSSTL